MIHLTLPSDARVHGVLEDTHEPECLTQDVLEIVLSNGIIIDVGWYPEHDPSGCFWIRAFVEDWENQLIDPPIKTRTPRQAQETIETLVFHFNREVIPTGRSSDSVIEPEEQFA